MEQRKAAFNVMLKLLMSFSVASVKPDVAVLPRTAAKDIAEAIKRMGKEH